MKRCIRTHTRRSVLVGGARIAAAGAVLTQAPYVSRALGDTPLKIGVLEGKTGNDVVLGEDRVAGMNLCLEQAGNKLLGRPCETVWFEDPDPQTGAINAEKLIQVEKVVALLGGSTSATALAESAVAKRSKIPFVLAGVAARELTGSACNKYTFREGWTVPAASRALAPYLQSISKKWYILAASYIFGEDIQRAMTASLKAANGDLVGSDLVPANTIDFSAYLLKIRAAQPDVLILGLQPVGVLNFLKQFKELGLDQTAVVGAIGISQADIWASGSEQSVSKGFFFIQSWYFANPNNTAEEKALNATYLQRRGKPPSEKVWEGWYSMKMLLTAIENAKTTDPAKVVPALENLRLSDGNYMRSWDHQMMQPFLIVKVNKQKVPNDKWDVLDVVQRYPARVEDLPPLYGDETEVGCKMEPL